MAKHKSIKPVRFPVRFEKNGRIGTVYRLGNGTLKTYFSLRWYGEGKHAREI
ncbi:MAG: hypothetical protein H0X73_00285 [Chthoniobacterales bacterium]|nr:hypothetical protein [Chthoniobacterales bacterium]